MGLLDVLFQTKRAADEATRALEDLKRLSGQGWTDDGQDTWDSYVSGSKKAIEDLIVLYKDLSRHVQEHAGDNGIDRYKAQLGEYKTELTALLQSFNAGIHGDSEQFSNNIFDKLRSLMDNLKQSREEMDKFKDSAASVNDIIGDL